MWYVHTHIYAHIKVHVCMHMFMKSKFSVGRDLYLCIAFHSCRRKNLLQYKVALTWYRQQSRILPRNPQIFNSYAPVLQNMEYRLTQSCKNPPVCKQALCCTIPPANHSANTIRSLAAAYCKAPPRIHHNWKQITCATRISFEEKNNFSSRRRRQNHFLIP